MRVGHIELFVKDPEVGRKWYELILKAEFVREQADGMIQWLRLGDTEILLRPGEPPAGGEIYRQARSAIVLYTDDLDGTVAALKSRGLAFEGDDGPGCPTFRDPDGNWFQLVQPDD